MVLWPIVADGDTMMLPSITPMVLAQARIQIGATPPFVAGYLLT